MQILNGTRRSNVKLRVNNIYRVFASLVSAFLVNVKWVEKREASEWWKVDYINAIISSWQVRKRVFAAALFFRTEPSFSMLFICLVSLSACNFFFRCIECPLSFAEKARWTNICREAISLKDIPSLLDAKRGRSWYEAVLFVLRTTL